MSARFSSDDTRGTWYFYCVRCKKKAPYEQVKDGWEDNVQECQKCGNMMTWVPYDPDKSDEDLKPLIN